MMDVENLVIDNVVFDERWTYRILHYVAKETGLKRPEKIREYLKDYSVEERDEYYILRSPNFNGLHFCFTKDW